MQPVLRTVVTLLLTTTTTLLRAQGSGYSTGGIELSPRVSTYYLVASLTEASRKTRWLQFVVLWRGQSGWHGGRQGLDTAMLRQAQTDYNTARKAAAGRDGMFVGGQSGGVAYTAEADSARRTLTVLGQRFSIPRSDRRSSSWSIASTALAAIQLSRQRQSSSRAYLMFRPSGRGPLAIPRSSSVRAAGNPAAIART